MPLVIILISVVGIFLRLWKLHGRDLWGDEIYQFTCMKPLAEPFWTHQTYGDHSCFPGEYLLHYPLVKMFPMNKWILVGPHLLINVFAFYLLYKICQIYYQSWAGYLTAFLLYTYNGNLIFHSLEFRPYAVLPVLALASLYFNHRVWNADFQKSRMKMFFTGVLFFITINYHIYGIAIFLLPVVLTFFYQRIQKTDFVIFPWKWFLIVAMLSIPVWVWYASFNHLGLAPAKMQSVVDTFQYIDDPKKKFVSFLKSILGNLIAIKKGRAILVITAFLFLFLSKNRFGQLLFACLLIILPIGLILYFDIRNHYWFLDRQFVWVMPWAAVFIGWVFDDAFVKTKLKFFQYKGQQCLS